MLGILSTATGVLTDSLVIILVSSDVSVIKGSGTALVAIAEDVMGGLVTCLLWLDGPIGTTLASGSCFLPSCEVCSTFGAIDLLDGVFGAVVNVVAIFTFAASPPLRSTYGS